MGSRACLSILLVAATAIAMPQPAFAVALRPNKATDDSVCDLTHDTNEYFGARTLIPSAASAKDQIDAYFRLGGEFVANRCRNGQLLMLQGSASLDSDVRSLTELANSSCAVASVTRTEIVLKHAIATKPGFELRCTIIKHDELVRKLNELEQADPMASLKARMYEAARRAEGGAPAGSDSSASAGRDCGKFTMSSVLGFGGHCR